MSEYLYVCHFSNGHIKVGRSISPKSRIASHADRVACLGVELVEHHIVECVGHSAPAESELIERCTELCTKRNRSEWFEGLEYTDICAEAIISASKLFPSKDVEKIEKIEIKNVILDAAIKVEGSVNALALSIGVAPNVISNWRLRGVPKSWSMLLEYRYEANRQPEKAV